MIGRVEWGEGDAGVVATLGDDGRFAVVYGGSTADPVLADSLTGQCRESYGGPAAGRYGVAFLHDLAARFGGTVTLGDFPPGDPSVAY